MLLFFNFDFLIDNGVVLGLQTKLDEIWIFRMIKEFFDHPVLT